MSQEQRSLPTRGTKSALFYGYIVAIAAFCILLVVYGVRFSYGVFFIPMSTELGWSSAATSLAYSISMIIEGIFNVILGGITDKYGPRLVMTISGILVGLGYSLMIFVHSTWQLFLIYGLIIGVGMGGIFVPLIALIARWFTFRRSLMTGVVMSGAGIGMLLLAPLANYLINRLSWRTTFLILGILVLVVITVAAQFLKRAPSTLGTAPFGKNIKQLEKEPAQGLSFKEALRSYQFWFMFFIFICYGFASLSISVHIVPHAIETGISATLAATILAALGGSGIIGRLGLGLLGDRLGNRLVMIMGFLGFLASLFFMMFSEAAVILFLFAFIFGVAQGGVSTSQSPLTARLFGLKSHGMIFGFGGLGYTIGAALGPFLTGHIFDITGSYYLAFVSCIIATAIGLILILLMKPIKTVSPDQARF